MKMCYSVAVLHSIFQVDSKCSSLSGNTVYKSLDIQNHPYVELNNKNLETNAEGYHRVTGLFYFRTRISVLTGFLIGYFTGINNNLDRNTNGKFSPLIMK